MTDPSKPGTLPLNTQELGLEQSPFQGQDFRACLPSIPLFHSNQIPGQRVEGEKGEKWRAVEGQGGLFIRKPLGNPAK